MIKGRRADLLSFGEETRDPTNSPGNETALKGLE
jgi:hypothetical protein